MAPKKAKPKLNGKSKEEMEAEEEAKAEAARAASAKERELRENQARQVTEKLREGTGPPPFWIQDAAAKIRDPQTTIAQRVHAANSLADGAEEAKPFVAFFAGAISCAVIGDEFEDVRCAVIKVFDNLGGLALPYADTLTVAVTKDRDAVVRQAAAKAMSSVCRPLQIDLANQMCGFMWQLHHMDEPDPEILRCFGCVSREVLPLIDKLVDAQREFWEEEEKMKEAEEAAKRSALAGAKMRRQLEAEKANAPPPLRIAASEKLCRAALRGCSEKLIRIAEKAFVARNIECMPDMLRFRNSILHDTERAKYNRALEQLSVVAVDDPSETVREAATLSLSDLDLSTDSLLDSLGLALLSDDNPVKRFRAAAAFGKLIRASSKMAATTLARQGHTLETASMSDSVPGVRQAAAHALGGSAKDAATVAEELCTILEEAEAAERKKAARSLGAIGEPAVPYVGSLFKASILDEDFSVRYWAADSLAALSSSGAPSLEYANCIAALALYDKDSEVRVRANDALGAMKEFIGQVWEEFSVENHNEEQARQEKAAAALTGIGVRFSGLLKPTEKQVRRVAKVGGTKKVIDETVIVPPPKMGSRSFKSDVKKFFDPPEEEEEEEVEIRGSISRAFSRANSTSPGPKSKSTEQLQGAVNKVKAINALAAIAAA